MRETSESDIKDNDEDSMKQAMWQIASFFYRKVRKTKTMWEICLMFVAAIYTLVS